MLPTGLQAGVAMMSLTGLQAGDQIAGLLVQIGLLVGVLTVGARAGVQILDHLTGLLVGATIVGLPVGV